MRVYIKVFCIYLCVATHPQLNPSDSCWAYNPVVSISIHQWLKLMTWFCCLQSLQHAPILKVLKSSNMHIRCSNYLISLTFCLTHNCITTAHTVFVVCQILKCKLISFRIKLPLINSRGQKAKKINLLCLNFIGDCLQLAVGKVPPLAFEIQGSFQLSDCAEALFIVICTFTLRA